MITKDHSPVWRRKKRIAGKRKNKFTICTLRAGQLQGKGHFLWTLSLTADLSLSPGWTHTALGVNGVIKGNFGK